MFRRFRCVQHHHVRIGLRGTVWLSLGSSGDDLLWHANSVQGALPNQLREPAWLRAAMNDPQTGTSVTLATGLLPGGGVDWISSLHEVGGVTR